MISTNHLTSLQDKQCGGMVRFLNQQQLPVKPLILYPLCNRYVKINTMFAGNVRNIKREK